MRQSSALSCLTPILLPVTFVGAAKRRLAAESIPKYVEDLTIPQVLYDTGESDTVEIAFRQITQQVLPTNYPATTLWAYGNPYDSASFHHPSGTIEAGVNEPLTVTWINELVKDPDECRRNPYSFYACNYLPHILVDKFGVPIVDQTLHWAAPNQMCKSGEQRTDCAGNTVEPYEGPIPVTVHVHGAHVESQSDGYPESWFLPRSNNIPEGYVTEGTYYNSHDWPSGNGADDQQSYYNGDDASFFGVDTTFFGDNSTDDGDDIFFPRFDINGNFYGDDASTGLQGRGHAVYKYDNQEANAMLFYHDHTLGITRLNVYAGGAGFWFIRNRDESANFNSDCTAYANFPYNIFGGTTTGKQAFPGPPPTFGEDPNGNSNVRRRIREIALAIQPMSFYDDGSLFYPANRAYFEGCDEGLEFAKTYGINAPFKPRPISDISPIWCPETYFDTMVVNGKTWPKLDVAPERYRFRILNVADSNFLNLALFTQDNEELPLYIIGTEQGLLPNIVKLRTGFYTNIGPCENGDYSEIPQKSRRQALLIAPGERYDVIIDFTGLPAGTEIIMTNTAPDSPFNGFDKPFTPANPKTTGEVMKFIVTEQLSQSRGDQSTPPNELSFKVRDSLQDGTVTRDLALKELTSQICIEGKDACNINGEAQCNGDNSLGPVMAMLGYHGSYGKEQSVGMMWSDPIFINPSLGDIEVWEIWNWTEDAHPIHLHLVAFQIIGRFSIDNPSIQVSNAFPWEAGFKDTVIAYPGQVTKIKAMFDRPGLYAWHCHILSHEDNEMMLPFCVGDGSDCPAALL